MTQGNAWDVKTHPYRVTWSRHSRHLPRNWGSHSKTFKSFAEAKTALDKLFEPGVYFASLEVVDGVIPDAWHWTLLGTRQRKQPIQLTSTGREHERLVSPRN